MGKTLSIAPKRSSRSPGKKNKGSRWHLRLGLGAVVVALMLRVFFIQTLRVPSRSMEDSLLMGDYLLVDKVSYGIRWPLIGIHFSGWSEARPGDIVVFRSPQDPRRTYVKRCIATAGHQVEIRNKVIYVDGERLVDPAFSKYIDVQIIPENKGSRDHWGPEQVPEGHLFVMGDNRDNSRDSRHWGFLPLELVVGKAVGVCWSFRPEGQAVYAAAGAWPATWIGWSRRLPQRLRWQRMGKRL